MRKPIVYIFFSTLLIFNSMLSAQDKKAQAILDDVAATTRSYTSVKIEFDYTMENKAQKINEKFQGTLTSKGDNYRIEVAEQVIISNGKTIWTYLESANEVQVNEVSNDSDGFSPSRLLSSWGEDYKSRFISENATEYQIELTPKKSSNFTRVQLTIDKPKKQIKRIQLYDKSSNVFTYLVKKFLVNQPVQDKLFVFDPAQYPGVEVIDLR